MRPNNAHHRKMTVSRTIPASSDAIWAVLADFPNISRWTAGVKRSRALGEQTSGVGARRHCDLAPMGAIDETAREWDEGKRMVVTIDKASGVPIKWGEATFTLVPAGGGTSVTVGYRFRAKGGPFGGLIAAALHGQLRKAWGGWLKELETAAQLVR